VSRTTTPDVSAGENLSSRSGIMSSHSSERIAAANSVSMKLNRQLRAIVTNIYSSGGTDLRRRRRRRHHHHHYYPHRRRLSVSTVSSVLGVLVLVT